MSAERRRRWGCRTTAAVGCSAAARPSDGRAVGDHAGDVGRQVHDVGQVQHERRLGDVHRRAVRGERVGHRAHGVLVLLEVLARPGEAGGEGEVVRVVAGTPDRAGEHPRGDQARSRRRTSISGVAPTSPSTLNVQQAGVAARPAGRAATRRSTGAQPRRRRSRARTTFSSSPAADPAYGLGDGDRPTPRRTASPSAKTTSSRALAGSRRRGERRAIAGSAPSPTVVTQRRSRAASDDDLGHDEHRRLGVVTVEGEGGEGDQPAARQPTLVAHDRVSHQRCPTSSAASANRSAARELEPGGLAPADEPSPLAHPGQGAVSREEGEQRTGQRDVDGAHDEVRLGAPGRRRSRRGSPGGRASRQRE